MNRITIHPSLISSDLLNLETTIRMLEPHCDGFHLDIMDNHFVPNLTWGAPFINAVARISTKQLALHLMIDNPLAFLPTITTPPETIVIIHIESKINFSEFFEYTKKHNLRSCIAISPKTTLACAIGYLGIVDQVLLMSVEPGFSGQQFMPSAYDRLAELAAYKKHGSLSFVIGMDGGISTTNIGQLADMGCQQFAVASAIFSANDPVNELQKLYAAAAED